MGIASEALKNFKGFNLKNLPEVEPVSPGHRACQGCGEVLALRQAMKALGTDVVVCSATGCMEIITSPFPQSAWRVPWIHVAFENAAAVVSGVESAYKALNRKKKINSPNTVFVGYGGDGATADIGMQALSGALERGHNFIYMCFDNEAYMNTGIQRSSSTPYGAMTTTSPRASLASASPPRRRICLRLQWPTALLCGHGVRGLPHGPHEQGEEGLFGAWPRVSPHLLALPTGWRCGIDESIEVARLAVQSKVFPLYEVIDGVYHLSRKVAKPKPVTDYFKPQRRFRHLTEVDINKIQEKIDADYEALIKKCVVEEKKEKEPKGAEMSVSLDGA